MAEVVERVIPRPARSITAVLRDGGRGHRPDQLPPDVIQQAKHRVLDWVGVLIAGPAESVSALVRGEIIEEASEARVAELGRGYTHCLLS